MSVILQSLLYLISHLLVVKKVVRRRNKVNIVQQIDGVHFVTSDLVGINDTQVLLKDLPRVKELHLVHYLGWALDKVDVLVEKLRLLEQFSVVCSKHLSLWSIAAAKLFQDQLKVVVDLVFNLVCVGFQLHHLVLHHLHFLLKFDLFFRVLGGDEVYVF